MNRRLASFAIVSIASTARAAGLGASDFGYLDGYSIDKRTHALTLLLVIDRPLEDGLTKPKVMTKIRGYHQVVFGGNGFSDAHPEADLSAGVRLDIYHFDPKNSLGRSVLEQIVGYAKEMKFNPVAVVAAKK